MKKIIYPGSFNPFHIGHVDVVRKALQIADRVIISKGINPEKNHHVGMDKLAREVEEHFVSEYVSVKCFSGLLAEFVEKEKPDAIIKGLRSSIDFEYEKNQQYWNEDLGLIIPTIYIISDRRYCHLSSSALRNIKEIK